METVGSPARPSLSRRLAALAVLAALSATAAADGNLTAYVDAAGDRWVIGDDASNDVRIGSGGDDQDTFRISGGDVTTTVNGLPQVTLFAPGMRMIVLLAGGNNVAWLGTDYGSSPSRCGRDLLVVTGDGRDELRGMGPFPSVFADLGPGNDLFAWGEGASDVRKALLRMGDGADRIEIETGLYDSVVKTGAGDDRLSVGWSAWRDKIDLGAGNDRATLNGGDLELDSGAGDDVIVLDGAVRGFLTLGTGYSQDLLRINGLGSRGAPIEPLSIFLGADDDRLELGDAVLGRAVLDGGTGRDTYLDRGNDFVSEPPDVRGFELPKPTLGPALSIPTRIAGRVVDEDGAPVPGAVAFLPELGLLGTTDSAGRFAFDPVTDERKTLELVVGAEVRGRARSGAAPVALLPYDTSDAGDITLEPDLVDVLVYGSSPGWEPTLAATLESRLLRTGLRPAEVTRLTSLPPDLTPYGVIWHVGSSIPPGDFTRLAGFVRAGRGLFLSGGTRLQDAVLAAFVNTLVRGGGVLIVSPFWIQGSYSKNPIDLQAFLQRELDGWRR